MRDAEQVTFGGAGFDRAAHLRAGPCDPLCDPGARVLPLWRGKPLFADGLAWVPPDHPVLAVRGTTIFLGRDGAVPCYAADLSGWQPDEDPGDLHPMFDPTEQRHPALPETHVFAELRSRMTGLSALEAELAATARALIAWHDTHGFCARCGAASEITMGGWQRTCPACQAHHFPRTDPVVIMLILSGNDVLLGRSPGWPEGMYSLLAGFVEPGETVEAAVRREVAEESGVAVGEVGYLASQPWPFPASLMLGCRGVALSRDIIVDPVELEDALWVPRERMLRIFCGEDESIRAPRNGAIAGFLLRRWLEDRLD